MPTPNGTGEQLVAAYPSELGVRPGLERALVWTRFAPEHAGLRGLTESELVAVLGEPERRTLRVVALPS